MWELYNIGMKQSKIIDTMETYQYFTYIFLEHDSGFIFKILMNIFQFFGNYLLNLMNIFQNHWNFSWIGQSFFLHVHDFFLKSMQFHFLKKIM